MHVTGLMGVVMFCVGMLLLWKARRGILDWLVLYFRVFRSEFTRRGGLPLADPLAAAVRPRRKNTALLVAGGFGLMVLDQVLFLLDLAL